MPGALSHLREATSRSSRAPRTASGLGNTHRTNASNASPTAAKHGSTGAPNIAVHASHRHADLSQSDFYSDDFLSASASGLSPAAARAALAPLEKAFSGQSDTSASNAHEFVGGGRYRTHHAGGRSSIPEEMYASAARSPTGTVPMHSNVDIPEHLSALEDAASPGARQPRPLAGNGLPVTMAVASQLQQFVEGLERLSQQGGLGSAEPSPNGRRGSVKGKQTSRAAVWDTSDASSSPKAKASRQGAKGQQRGSRDPGGAGAVALRESISALNRLIQAKIRVVKAQHKTPGPTSPTAAAAHHEHKAPLNPHKAAKEYAKSIKVPKAALNRPWPKPSGPLPDYAPIAAAPSNAAAPPAPSSRIPATALTPDDSLSESTQFGIANLMEGHSSKIPGGAQPPAIAASPRAQPTPSRAKPAAAAHASPAPSRLAKPPLSSASSAAKAPPQSTAAKGPAATPYRAPPQRTAAAAAPRPSPARAKPADASPAAAAAAARARAPAAASPHRGKAGAAAPSGSKAPASKALAAAAARGAFRQRIVPTPSPQSAKQPKQKVLLQSRVAFPVCRPGPLQTLA